jgi:hypothetical protein
LSDSKESERQTGGEQKIASDGLAILVSPHSSLGYCSYSYRSKLAQAIAQIGDKFAQQERAQCFTAFFLVALIAAKLYARLTLCFRPRHTLLFQVVRRFWMCERVSEPAREHDRAYRGLNFFSAEDQALIETLARGEFNLHGFQNKSRRVPRREKTSGQVSRTLKRLRLHGLVKKVGHTYRYYLTVLGKPVIASGLKLKNLVLIPHLALAPAR